MFLTLFLSCRFDEDSGAALRALFFPPFALVCNQKLSLDQKFQNCSFSYSVTVESFSSPVTIVLCAPDNQKCKRRPNRYAQRDEQRDQDAETHGHLKPRITVVPGWFKPGSLEHLREYGSRGREERRPHHGPEKKANELQK